MLHLTMIDKLTSANGISGSNNRRVWRNKLIANGEAKFGRLAIAARKESGMQAKGLFHDGIEMRQIDERLEICNIYILDFLVNLFSVLWVFAQLAEYSDQSNCCWLTASLSVLSVFITLASLVHLLPSSYNSQ